MGYAILEGKKWKHVSLIFVLSGYHVIIFVKYWEEIEFSFIDLNDQIQMYIYTPMLLKPDHTCQSDRFGQKPDP